MTAEAAAGAATRGETPNKAFSRFEWMLALRYLRARRAQGFVSVIAGFSFLGIMLGVATLIVVMSVMNGFHKELLDKIVGLNGHVFVQGADTPLTDYDEVTKRIEKVPGVVLAMPMVEGAAGVSSPWRQSGAQARGVREADLKRLPGVAGNIRTGTLEGFDDAGGVAIGQRMADNLSLRVGDTITIIIAKGAATPFGVTPRIKSYPVKAIFQIGMAEMDNLFVYMPLREAQAFFDREGEATVIEAFVDRPEKMDVFNPLIQKAAGRLVILTDWRQQNATFFNVLQTESNVMFMILFMIVLVAALNIVSGLTMLVKDKGRDIAILRTMGATRWSVMRVFLITGSAIGIVGGLAGFVLGLALAHNVESIRSFLNYALHANLFPSEVYFLSRLPAVVDFWQVTLILVMTLALSVAASLYPAWRAARVDPVEALRYE